MRENETRSEKAKNEKARIRERYKGVNQNELELIPAIAQENFYEDKSEKRVAVYARVSTDDPRQTSSYELQKNHYTDLVSHHPGWKLVDIYADEGISGTSLQHRDAFLRMISDCHAGKIDLIVTKSVSRFARNVLDCIGHVRQLAALRPPIGILFETENIFTLNSNSEMSLSIISTLAQEESHNKSEIMNASIEMRFKRGIFLTPPLLGYDQDEDGNLIINEEEAKTVRLTFFMYLYGYSSTQIAETLTQLGRRTKKNNDSWSSSSVIQILQNERHCGDVLARKTWTPNYLDHKSRKNNQDRNQYRKRDHHEAIVSRDDFIAVQHLISNAKYGYKGILPKLQVISDGALKGFVTVNPRWAAFSVENYCEASDSVNNDDKEQSIEIFEVEAMDGDFDMRGFEIARSQFFDIAGKTSATFTPDYYKFSIESIRKIGKCLYIEVLVHPRKQLLAIRPCKKEMRSAIRWANTGVDYYFPRAVKGAAYIDTLYEIFGWNQGCKYRVQGLYKEKDSEKLIIFDMRDTEMFIPQSILESEEDNNEESDLLQKDIKLFTTGPKKDIKAYPSAWANNFGHDFYQYKQARDISIIETQNDLNINDKGKPFNDSNSLKVTANDDVGREIKKIMFDMKQEVSNDGE